MAKKPKQLNQLLKSITENQIQEEKKTSPNINLDIAYDRFVLLASKKIDGFVIDDQNHDVIVSLIEYFTGNECHLDHKKGIFLFGNVGSGKTKLMEILRECKFQSFGLKECRDMSERFLSDHYKGIHIYGKGSVAVDKIRHMCFDDLGAEDVVNYYGNKVNVMSNIITDRYRHFTNYGLKTHMTSNLTPDEIDEKYGSRVISRMQEMMNFVVLGDSAESKDRRLNA